MSAWLRLNRAWLIALPVAALVAALLGSGRLVLYWLPEQQYQAVRGAGEVHFTETFVDLDGEHVRDVTVEVLQVVPTTEMEYGGATVTPEMPSGTTLWAVDLRMAADPDVVLDDCTVAIMDESGRLHASSSTMSLVTVEGRSIFIASEWCVPADAPGPSARFFDFQQDDDLPSRPEVFEVRSYVITPQDVTPERIRTWWARGVPRFAEITLVE